MCADVGLDVVAPRGLRRAQHFDMGNAVFQVRRAVGHKAVLAIKRLQMRLRPDADGLWPPQADQLLARLRHEGMTQRPAPRGR